MSELDQLREELDSSNRKLAEAHKFASLGRLMSGIVHEINTPIGSILSNNETLSRSVEALKKMVRSSRESGSALPEKAEVLLSTLETLAGVDKIACERIQGVVRGLKTFARVDESEIRKVDLNEIIRNTLKLTASICRRRVQVVTELGDLPEIECHPGLLGQVFLNLIVNSAQAIEGEGVIEVCSEMSGNMAHVAVKDNGPGISAEAQARIFSAGFTTKPMGEGTGLGLTITREIVEDTHGGKLEFETELGKGTTFHVWIPASRPGREEQAVSGQ